MQPLFLRANVHEVGDIAHQRTQVQRQALDFDVAGLDLGHVQHIVDQIEQMLAAAIDDIQTFELRFGQRGLLAQQTGETEDGVQRRAQLVAHAGEKGALGPVRHLRRFARQHQRHRAFLHLLFQMVLVLDQLLFGVLAVGQVDEGREESVIQHDAGDFHDAHFAVLAGHMILMRLDVLAGLGRGQHGLSPGR